MFQCIKLALIVVLAYYGCYGQNKRCNSQNAKFVTLKTPDIVNSSSSTYSKIRIPKDKDIKCERAADHGPLQKKYHRRPPILNTWRPTQSGLGIMYLLYVLCVCLETRSSSYVV